MKYKDYTMNRRETFICNFEELLYEYLKHVIHILHPTSKLQYISCCFTLKQIDILLASEKLIKRILY